MANQKRGNKKSSGFEISRRSAIKTSISGLAATGLSGKVLASKSEKSGQEEPGDAAPPPTIEYGKKIKKLDGLILPLMGDKDQTISYINEANTSKNSRQQARENIKDLWDQITIKRKTKKQGKGSNKTRTTVYKLQGSVEKANETIQTLQTRGMGQRTVSIANSGSEADVSSVINSGAGESGDDDTNNDISVQWAPHNSHLVMNEFAGKNLDLAPKHWTTLKYAGDDPDAWEYDVTGMPEKWEKSWDQPARRWTHASGTVWLGTQRVKVGSAPSMAKKYMKKPHNASSDFEKYKNMGFALHFLADLGNPMHTGAYVTQMQNKWVHSTYEISANKHLEDPDHTNYLINNVDFSQHPDFGPNDYVEVDDPNGALEFFNKWANHAKRLADISSEYSYDHVQKTYDYGSGTDIMEVDKDMETQIEYLTAETMKFMMGYVEEYNSDVGY